VNIQQIVAAKELAARNTVIESIHDWAVRVHEQVEKGDIEKPLDVVDLAYRLVQDAFAASIHMAYAEEIVTEEQAIDAFKMIYGWDEEAAKEAFAKINAEYHKQREDMENAS
jgi:hypothetical protein